MTPGEIPALGRRTGAVPLIATEHGRLAAARSAFQAVGGRHSCDCVVLVLVVELQIDGDRFAVEFDLDVQEHMSRRSLGIGAATNTGLLHALWELPAGLPVPAASLGSKDLATLRELGDGYVRGRRMLTRMFNPAGRIRSVAVVSRSMEGALAGVARLPPIFRRLAVALERPSPTSPSLRTRTGIGEVVFSEGRAEVLAEPRTAILGVPAVYRWWLAELAYRNWGYVNCAHCVI